MMVINLKRRQRGLRKLAAALRILDSEAIVPDRDLVLLQPDGKLIEMVREPDGTFSWSEHETTED